MEPIEVTTGDLVLRGWRPEDADAVYRACQDPLIHRWTRVPMPYRYADATAFVGEVAPAHWHHETAAPLGVFHASTGELLGSCGLITLDGADRFGELGVWIAPWARGRGVAERAGRAVAHWAFEVLDLRVLVWQAVLGNHVSKLVAERIGFVFDGVLRAGLRGREGQLLDGWRATLLPGEVRDAAPDWVARGGPGASRAAAFADPPQRLPAGPVTLRHAGEDDLDDMTATCRDPEAIRWTTVPVPYPREQAVVYLHQRVRAGWAAGTMTVFVIADESDRFAGNIDLRIMSSDPGTAEIGFLVAPWARGKGYATAATRALCSWGFQTLGLSRIVWRAHVGNDASRRVAERAGFVVEGVQRGGCEQRGERRDAWVATLLPGEV